MRAPAPRSALASTGRGEHALEPIELPARFGDREGQLALARHKVLERARRGGLDLALLPELALTGYLGASRSGAALETPARFAEPLDGPTTASLATLAREAGCAIAGPLVERDGDALYNSLVVVGRDGALLAHYRKRHPWYPETWATPGALPYPSFSLGGLAVTACICFDVHFVASEAGALLFASDVLLFPSAWVQELDRRAELLGELSQRFGLTIVNANWGEGEPRIAGQGGSRVVVPRSS